MKVSRLVSAEELLVLLNSNTKLIFIVRILLKLFFSNFLTPLKLKAPSMVFFDGNIFKISFFSAMDIFSTRKIRPFSHENVAITQFDVCRWFYAPKWLPLILCFSEIDKILLLVRVKQVAFLSEAVPSLRFLLKGTI